MIEIAARNWTLSKWNHKKCPTVLSKNYPTVLSKKLKKSFGCLTQVKFTSTFGPVWSSNRGPQHEIPWAIIIASHWPYSKGNRSLLSTSLCRIWSQNPIKIRVMGFNHQYEDLQLWFFLVSLIIPKIYFLQIPITQERALQMGPMSTF